MSDKSEQFCRICLRSDKMCIIAESSQYLNVFNKLFEAHESKLMLWLCIWCKAIINKVNGLLDLANCAKQLFGKKIAHVQLIHKQFSFHHNPLIDIPPKEICMVKNNEIREKDEINTDNLNLIKEKNILYNKSNKLKKDKLDEINFDVLYLNVDEQRKEIEDKKRSGKYHQWNFRCEYCGISFMFIDDYDEHNKRHNKLAGNHSCDICRLRFKSVDVLSQHKLAHKRRFKCRRCGTKLKRWSHCVAHRLKCGTNNSPAVCAVCKKICGDEHSLKVHLKNVHQLKHKYVCDHCDRSFRTKQRLTVHIRCHTGIKPFSCATCQRTFATGSNLRAHTKVHSDTKNYYCVECDKYYKTEKSLKRHFMEALRHAGDGRFLCEECSKKFATQKKLQKHITTAHLTQYRCAFCLKLFSNNANLRKHVRSIHTTTES